ncbi:MAG: SGNH/GDSL hydrolase family protein, partial [Nitrospinae bacterium]|nr:SGNH/GDSL hydrolase family protein [Nitrospinota bacterium]
MKKYPLPLRYGRSILCFLFLLFGTITFDWESPAWGVGVIVLYAVPLACQSFQNPFLRYGSLWLGVFLVLQTLLTPYFHYHIEYRTLKANINETIDKWDVPHKVTSDELGYRTYPRVDYGKKEGLRIFALGGSTTEEIHIDDQKTWAHLLQENLRTTLKRPVEVISTGVSGARTRNHFAKLERILQYQPDMVLMMPGINDWNKQILDHHTIYRFEPYFFRKSMLVKAFKGFSVFIVGPIKEKLFPAEKPKPPEPRRPGDPAFEKRDSLNRPFKFTWRPERVAEEYANYLEKVSAACKENKLPCLFITQPHGYRPDVSDEFKQYFWMTPPFQNYTLDLESLTYIADLYNDYLLDFAHASGHPTCDIAPHVKATLAYFFDHAHF